MKISISLVLLAMFGTTVDALAHGWCDYDEGYSRYDEPYFETMPLHEVIIDFIFMNRGEMIPERVERQPVWDEPGWVAPRARRPAEELKNTPPVVVEPDPERRRIVAGYRPPVPPVMPKPKREISIDVAPEEKIELEPESPKVEVDEEPKKKMAIPVPGAPGFVFSPFDEDKRKVDVRGLPSGSLARDPYTKQVFRVP